MTPPRSSSRLRPVVAGGAWLRPASALRVGLTALCLTLLASGSLSSQVRRPSGEPKEPEKRILDQLHDFGPPDGKWLQDEYGQDYYVRQYPKGEEGVHYLRIKEGVIRIPGGLPLHIVREDDDYFYYKYYRPLRPEEQVAPEPPPEPEPDPEPEPTAQDVSEKFEFEYFGEGLPTEGRWRQGFELADMNEDGELDLVHGPPRKGPFVPQIFLGDGRGQWRRWQEARFPNLPYDYGDVEVADFNGDGHLDLALGMHLTGVAVLLGNGKGAFRDWSEGLDRKTPDVGSVWSSRAIVAADFNGDGRIDLGALGEGMAGGADRPEDYAPPGGVTIYLNQGDGTWKAQRNSSYVFGDNVVAADFDADGQLDLLSASHTVGSKDVLWRKGEEKYVLQPLPALPERAVVQAIQPLDLDGDGDLDLAIGAMRIVNDVWHTEIAAYFREEDGSYRRVELISEPGSAQVHQLTAGDLDGDGHIDLVAGNAQAELWILRGLGGGRFARAANELTEKTPHCSIYEVKLADVNRDGRDELFASFSGESITIPLVGDVDGCDNNGSMHAWTVKGDETSLAADDDDGKSSAGKKAGEKKQQKKKKKKKSGKQS